jgi:SAM-dependent methyltransferase
MLAERPSEAQLSALYQETYFSTHAIGCAADDEKRAKGVRGQRKRVGWVRRFVRPGAAVLDVGCASGFFLEAARQQGFAVEGVELSQWAADEAKRRFGLTVTVGQLTDVPGPRPRFDAVTMWHSLEHTRDPIAALETARALLKEGGALAVELPNYRSIDAWGYGDGWSGWSVPYHFWHFSPKSLAAIVRRCGFEVRLVKTLPSTYVKERVKRIPILGLLRKVIASWYVGRDLVLVATKRSEPSIRAADGA